VAGQVHVDRTAEGRLGVAGAGAGRRRVDVERVGGLLDGGRVRFGSGVAFGVRVASGVRVAFGGGLR